MTTLPAVIGRSVLDARNHQGKFGQDYVRALASAAGLIIATFDLDVDGVDLGLRFAGRAGKTASPAIDIQVKSWSKPRSVAGEWHFSGLNEWQFNKLAGADYTIPRYLFLILVPSDQHTYVSFETEGMFLRHLGYYLSLQNQPRIERPDNTRRRAVRVPMSNVLTVRSLLNLVHPALAPVGSQP